MLVFFPTPYENELLYSILARYHIRSGNSHAETTMKDLYSNKNIRPYPYTPKKVLHLYNLAKKFIPESYNHWILKHTLYYYLSNFSKDDLKDKLWIDIGEGTYENEVKSLTRHVNKYLMFCPECTQEDYLTHGETYWRKDHQIPHVLYCIKHCQLLIESTVLCNPNIKKGKQFLYEAASYNNCILSKTPPSHISIEDRKLCLKIAENLIQISNIELGIKFDAYRDIYRYLLRRKGYIIGEKVNLNKLYKDFKRFYSDQILYNTNASFDENKRSNWLANIIKKTKQAFTPTKHILLIIFLGENVLSIMDFKKNSYNPFGQGPFKCLNPFSNHSYQNVISTFNLKKFRGIEIGEFECDCGFTFTSKVDCASFSIFQIKSVGKWEEEFESMLKNNSDNELMKEIRQIYIKYKRGMHRKKAIPEEVILTFRAKWLFIISENVDQSADILRFKYSSVYGFLRRHDNEWLKSNKPQINNYGIKKIDWAGRDIELEKQIKVAVESLLLREVPIRITYHSISKQAGRYEPISVKALKKLPKSKKCLEEFVESIEEFQQRKAHMENLNPLNLMKEILIE